MQQAPETPCAAVALVNAFLHRALTSRVTDLTVTKVHDLVYLAHGWFLATERRRLVAGGIHADADGVFSPSARSAGCRGTRKIDKLMTVRIPDSRTGLLVNHTPLIRSGTAINGVLDVVWDQWGKLSPWDLRQFTRREGSPWDLVWNDQDRSGNLPRRVPDTTIRLWFMYYVRGDAGQTDSSLDSDELESLGLPTDLGDLRVV